MTEKDTLQIIAKHTTASSKPLCLFLLFFFLQREHDGYLLCPQDARIVGGNQRRRHFNVFPKNLKEDRDTKEKRVTGTHRQRTMNSTCVVVTFCQEQNPTLRNIHILLAQHLVVIHRPLLLLMKL